MTVVVSHKDSIEVSRNKLVRANGNLDHIIGLLLRYSDDRKMYTTLTGGVVKYFEWAYETCWRFLKYYLLYTRGIEASTPREVFRMCSERGILPADVAAELIILIDVRNETIHTYDQAITERVIADIVKHAGVFPRVLECVPDK